MKFLNDVNITGNGADLLCAATVTFSGLSSSSETAAVMVNSSGVLSKRTLGSNAFNSTTIPTNNNQLTNGAGFVTSSGLTSLTAGTLIDVDGSGSTQTVNVDLSELTDMTGNIATTVDEIVLLDNGAQRRKRFSEIFGSNAYNSTTIPTNTNQLTNGAGFITGVTADAIGSAFVDADYDSDTKASIRTAIGAQALLQVAQVIDWTSSLSDAGSDLVIHADNYTNTTYSVGDGGLTQNNFTNTLKTKLDGIATSANNYTLPAASTSAIGGVKIKSTTTNTVTPATLTNTANRTYAVQLADTGGALVVNVPWSGGSTDVASQDASGLMSAADKTKLDEISEGATANTGDMTLAGAQTVSGAKTYSGIQTFNSDIALRFGTSSTFIEGATSGSKLMLNGQTDMFMRINGTTILQLDANKAELSKYLDITDDTDSTDATGDTGALRCEGGGSIAKKLYVGDTITGSADVIAYSDEKLKENVKTLDGKKVLEMRGVSFDRVDTGKASSGVIAQEMEKVAPELVIDDGNYKGVAYGNLVGYLIEAIKDQQKQINELKYILHGRPE